MRIVSVTLKNYRIHKELTVSFDPSRNLIGGPNESGKSTLAEAIHRALFLRAKTGGAIQKEMVSSIHPGDPEVSLRFEAGGVTWDLEKRFAGTKGSTRLTGAGMTTLKDDEADAKLTELLKTESGGRATSGQLASTWSHLWVWQGTSGEDPAAHASTHKDTLVQRLQKDGLTAVMQSATDQRVRERVAAYYDQLFTGTGKPKSGSKPELARLRLVKAEEDLQRARDTATRLEQAAIEHARAEQEITETAAVLPDLRQQHSATGKNLAQVTEFRRQEDAELTAFNAATARREQIAKDDLKIQELRKEAEAARTALAPAEEKQTTLATEEASARKASESADASLRDASQAARLARLECDLAGALLGALEKTEAHSRLAAQAERAGAIRIEVSRVKDSLSALPLLTAANLSELRKLDREAVQASLALDAMATGVELLQSDTAVSINGEVLNPGVSRVLTDSSELTVGEGVRIRIIPGGGGSLSDAKTLASSSKSKLADALERLILTDLDHATAVHEKRQALGEELAALNARLDAQGGDSLASELTKAADVLRAANSEVERRKALLDTDMAIPCPGTVADGRAFLASRQENFTHLDAAEARSRQSAEKARAAMEAATSARQRHTDEMAAAHQSVRDLDTRLKVLAETHGDAATRQANLSTAREAEKQAEECLSATRKAIANLAPETLSADLEHYQRAITQQESRHRIAEERRITARAQLAIDGSSDPQAELSLALARCDAAREIHASEDRRAKSVDKLHQLFNTSRETIDRNVVQPLADRVSRYLQCIFGSGTGIRVDLSDSGIQGIDLIRAGDSTFSFPSLSGGAKEQVAAAVRLAMAEILATDHDGCLPIIFDDAFAYTDSGRIQSLQRMLNLAALHGLQIIVLTCVPKDFSAFGANQIQFSRVIQSSSDPS